MNWLGVCLVSLAAFTVWEWLLVVLPVSLPAWLQPVAVVGVAYGMQLLPGRLLAAVAAAGAVALLHTFVKHGVVEPPPLRLSRRRRRAGRRVPDLP